MKVTAWNLFRLSLAISAGYELGRILPAAAIRLLRKNTVREIKQQYRRGMKKHEAGLRAVPDDRVAWEDLRRDMKNETPTGD